MWTRALDLTCCNVFARPTRPGYVRLGLRPGRDYFYQFDARDEESPVGHFRTAPRPDAMEAQLRFAFVTCQDWASGFYTAYRDMLQYDLYDLDVVLHLGDYTYEYAIGATPRGPAPAGFEAETVDLRTYRLRHTLYKGDSSFHFYRIGRRADHVAQFFVEGVGDTDGVHWVGAPMGRRLPLGLRLVQNGEAPEPEDTGVVNGYEFDGSTQFEYVSILDVLKALAGSVPR